MDDAHAVGLLRHTSPFSGGALNVVVTTARARLELLDGFEFRYDGLEVHLPMSAQRVFAFVALHRRPVLRTYVSFNLWLESPEDHATSCLRSALWRLRRSGYNLVEAEGQKLRLAPEVSVDVREAVEWARGMLGEEHDPALPRPTAFPLVGELLPDWYDDWVLLERERLRELRAHALECLCERLTALGRFAEAMELAQAAVRLDSLRESAHRLLIRVHLAEGNQPEALRHYDRYRRLLQNELGLDPSRQMEELVVSLVPR